MFDEKWEPRLVDFGFAKLEICEGSNTIRQNNFFAEYAAPESMDGSGYDHKVDVFAFGMILFRIVCDGAPIFTSKVAPIRVVAGIKAGERPVIPDGIPDIFRDLVTRCWHDSPDSRPEFAHIVKRLLDTEDPLFPGVDATVYQAYRERVFQATLVTEENEDIFDAPSVRPEDTVQFAAAKAQADAGSVEQMVAVGRKYHYGTGVVRDYEQAFRYFQMAADRDNTFAQYNVGQCFLNGNGTDVNFESAAHWFRLAARDPKLPQAIVPLVTMIRNQLIEIDDPTEEIRLLRRAADPPVSYSEAQYRLAEILEHGIGSDGPDMAGALRYYGLAHGNGVSGAGVDLASLYIEGKNGVVKDVERGVAILKQLATQGVPMAHYNLGCVYEATRFGILDMAKAMWHFEEAKKLELPLAFCKLGAIAFREARKPGVEPSLVQQYEREAADLMRQGADLGYAVAQSNYGKFLIDGMGVPPNIRKAKEYLFMAVQQGATPAMLRLAEILLTGRGRITKNPKAARKLLERAVGMGNTEARDRLSTLPP
jgi:TPR repeat protein